MASFAGLDWGVWVRSSCDALTPSSASLNEFIAIWLESDILTTSSGSSGFLRKAGKSICPPRWRRGSPNLYATEAPAVEFFGKRHVQISGVIAIRRLQQRCGYDMNWWPKVWQDHE